MASICKAALETTYSWMLSCLSKSSFFLIRPRYEAPQPPVIGLVTESPEHPSNRSRVDGVGPPANILRGWEQLGLRLTTPLAWTLPVAYQDALLPWASTSTKSSQSRGFGFNKPLKTKF